MSTAALPHNRLGIDYRDVPRHKVAIEGGIIDAHNHSREPVHTQIFVDAAHAYGIREFYTMCPLEHAAAIQEKFPGQFHFIAVPAWQNAAPTEEFFNDWRRRIETFAAPPLNSRMIKFHAAPGTCHKWGISLDHPRIRELAEHAYKLGYNFMTHVGDPKAWFYGNGRYAKPEENFGTFDAQFGQLERLLEKYPDRLHMGAHFGGSLENVEALARRLDKYPHYILDSSATKWIVRAVYEQGVTPVKDFITRYQDRILFGSDLVVGEKYDWDHYASRYWVHRKLWESDYRGQSPIEDPDAGKGFNPTTGAFDAAHADGIPHLAGLDLPAAILQKLYRGNAMRLLPR
jgi:hypothetical protein